jgi:polyhydroxybutyrate depolymerase
MLTMLARTVVVLMLLTTGSCVAAGDRDAALSSKPVERTLDAGGRERSLILYVPATLPPGAPLVIMLHGSTQTAASFRQSTGASFDALADRQGFVVAYLDGYKNNWDDCRKAASYPARADHIDDEAFVAAVVALLAKERGIDPKRVFAVGHSNGAQMAYRLALERPDLVAGIAAVSAGLPTPDNLDCREAKQPVAAIIINGMDDPINPWGGGQVPARGTVISTLATADYFVTLAGQTAPPKVAELPHRDRPT